MDRENEDRGRSHDEMQVPTPCPRSTALTSFLQHNTRVNMLQCARPNTCRLRLQRGAELTHKSLWRVLRSSRTLSSCCIPMRTAEGAAAALPESRSTPEGGVELKAVTVHTDAARELCHAGMVLRVASQ